MQPRSWIRERNSVSLKWVSALIPSILVIVCLQMWVFVILPFKRWGIITLLLKSGYVRVFAPALWSGLASTHRISLRVRTEGSGRTPGQ